MDKHKELIKELINKQFEIAGHDMTYDKLKELGLNVEQDDPNDNWYFKYTRTPEQAEEFKSYAMDRMVEVLNMSKQRALYEFGWFDLSFGLRDVESENKFIDEEE
jgi:hypothetical protein